MVQSIHQDFKTATQIMRQLNGDNRNPIAPLQRLKDDFESFIQLALKAKTTEDQGVHYSSDDLGDIVIAKLPLGQIDVIYVLSAVKLHDGISDVVIVQSTTDDRYVVLSGDSLKSNLKDGVMAYSLPLVQDAASEVTNLMKPYIEFSDALVAKHTENGKFKRYDVMAEIPTLIVPLSDPYPLYPKYMTRLVWPEPEMFLGKNVREIAP